MSYHVGPYTDLVIAGLWRKRSFLLKYSLAKSLKGMYKTPLSLLIS